MEKLGFELTEKQFKHSIRLYDILSENICGFDMSPPGEGKTFVSSYIRELMNFEHCVVICPAKMEGKWNRMRDYGVRIDKVISFQSLRSIKGKQPKHGLLNRLDISDTTLEFETTEECRKLIIEGCFFIFDECQNIKNISNQFEACKTLSSQIIETGGKSRFLLISGTPIDTEEHSINMMRMLGFIKTSKLFTYYKISNRIEFLGAQELINFSLIFDKEATEKIIREYTFDKNNIVHFCYLLFQKVIKKKITSYMPATHNEISLDCKNGYYFLPDDEALYLIDGIDQLHNASKYVESTNAVNKSNLGGIIKALTVIERAKVKLFAKQTRKELISNPNCKVVIACNYKATIADLSELLSDYNPLILCGDVDKKLQDKRIESFQEFNLDYRLIICNLQVCSTGIDLDDKHGEFPRICFASPKYNISEMHQLTGRFLRMNTKSSAKLRFVYGIVGKKETSILNALAKKTEVMRETLEYHAHFPGDYKDEVEDGYILESDTKYEVVHAVLLDKKIESAPKTIPKNCFDLIFNS